MAVRRRAVSGILIGGAVLLCVFGAYESIDAAAGLLRPLPDGPLRDLMDYPLWSMAHFVPGLLFMALAPLQLWPSFRNRHRTLHRRSGRLVVACGVALGVSGVSFPFTMPQRPMAEQIFMTYFGAVLLFFLAKAFEAARQRDLVRHRDRMIRLFANGQTITTQRLLLPVFIVSFGVSSVDEFWTHFLAAAWLAFGIQLAVAEWWIRRPAPVPAGRARPSAEPAAV
jgi:uncharacterized membrane protein